MDINGKIGVAFAVGGLALMTGIATVAGVFHGHLFVHVSGVGFEAVKNCLQDIGSGTAVGVVGLSGFAMFTYGVHLHGFAKGQAIK